MAQLERREALPAHPVPAGLAAPEAWRLRVDGLVAPGRACFYSVKWVDRLEVLADEAPTTGEAIARNRLPR